jgi:hypothetical protein
MLLKTQKVGGKAQDQAVLTVPELQQRYSTGTVRPSPKHLKGDRSHKDDGAPLFAGEGTHITR